MIAREYLDDNSLLLVPFLSLLKERGRLEEGLSIHLWNIVADDLSYKSLGTVTGYFFFGYVIELKPFSIQYIDQTACLQP